MHKTSPHTSYQAVKPGFSLIEVMLVLGISGLMLVGLLAGTFSSISNQRYTDAVRSFAEQLRSIYNEVIRPESLGAGNSSRAIIGKVVVFDPSFSSGNDRQFYTATITASANINLNPIQPDGNIMTELANADAKLYCGTNDIDDPSTVNEFASLWQVQFMQGRNSFLGTNPSQEFRGTFIIARSPVSNVVHTAYSKDIVYDLKNSCSPSNRGAEASFQNTLSDTSERSRFYQTQAINICMKSYDVNYVRAVQVSADGRNSSAVSVINADTMEDDPCR